MVAENIGSGPSLGQGKSVVFVNPLSLDVASDNVCLGVTRTLDLERNIGRSSCLNFKMCFIEWVILVKYVIRKLSKILKEGDQKENLLNTNIRGILSKTGEWAEGGTSC